MTGIVRGIKQNGRLSIPREAMRAIGVEPGDNVEIWVGQDEEGGPAIAITKQIQRCIFCSSYEDLITHQDKPLCKDCHNDIQGL